MALELSAGWHRALQIASAQDDLAACNDATAACEALGLRGPDADEARALTRRVAVGLVPRLANALRHGSLDGVFVL